MSNAAGKGRIRLMNDGDLELVLRWRNDPTIRSVMTTQHEIGLDEHCVWFERSKSNDRRTLLIYEEASPIGFANVEQVNSGTFVWGFYAAPEAPKGTGRLLCSGVLDYAFGQLAAHKIYGQILSGNERSIRLHQALGFQLEGTLREHCLIGATYHDLVCFGLLKQEWNAVNRETL